MARKPRFIVPGLVHLVQMRALAHLGLHVDAQDRDEALKGLLGDPALLQDVQLHAFVLLDDAWLMLLTPLHDAALPRLLQRQARAHVQRINRRHGRRGTVWDGRYRCAPLQAESCLLDAMVWMDAAPVRAGEAAQAIGYPWSSHRNYLGLQSMRGVSPHALVWAMGNTPFAREQAYAARVEAGVSAAMASRLQDAADHGWPLGDGVFLEALATCAGRPVVRRKAGRPRTQRVVPSAS